MLALGLHAICQCPGPLDILPQAVTNCVVQKLLSLTIASIKSKMLFRDVLCKIVLNYHFLRNIVTVQKTRWPGALPRGHGRPKMGKQVDLPFLSTVIQIIYLYYWPCLDCARRAKLGVLLPFGKERSAGQQPSLRCRARRSPQRLAKVSTQIVTTLLPSC